MAQHKWEIMMDKKYSIVVKWQIGGDAVLSVGRKELHVEDSRWFYHQFVLGASHCEIRFENEVIVGPLLSKLTVWAPQLYMDGKKIKPVI